MPIIKEVPRPCHCFNKPNIQAYGTGTIWECDDCGARYELSDDQREGKYWMKLYDPSNRGRY